MTESVKQNMDRHQVTVDGLFSEDRQEECSHTPDNLVEYIGIEESSNGLCKHFRCRCGKEIIEVFGFQGMREL